MVERLPEEQGVRGSIPRLATKCLTYHVVGREPDAVVGEIQLRHPFFGGVAQWLVQHLHKALVGGPNPPSATIIKQPHSVVALKRRTYHEAST